LHVFAFDRKGRFAIGTADVEERRASSDAGDPLDGVTDVVK
jgi:hypothetical protein